MDPKAENAESPTPAKNTSFSCSCGKKLLVKAELAGKKVKCPGCQQILTVPASETTRAFQESLSARDPSQATVGEAPGVDKDLCSFLAPPEGPDELGRLGGYRVVKILGHGGMGVVFKAEDVQLRRFVALKAMLPKLATNATAKDRFFREARSAAALKHDHIVAIHQVGEDRGAPFLAMEFLEGESLDDRLKREGRLPIAEVTRIGREVAEGLAAAHKRNLIHRDIKPANIWLEDERGRAKILDFGLARGLSDDLHLTQSGMMIGTPAYMPTEQASGGDVDHRCDLYSLGVMLYRMSTGGMPFKGKDAISLLSSIAFDTPAEPSSINPDIPPELNDLILQLLSKNRDDRPATATEVAQSLASVPLSTSGELPTPGPNHALTTKPPVKRSPGTVDIRRPETVRPPRRRGPMIAGLIAFVIVAMVAGVMVMFRPTPIGKLPDDNRAIEPIEKSLPKTLTNSIGMEFVLVPKGTLWMGGGGGKVSDKEVDIAHDFYLGKYEVTQEEWQKVLNSNPSAFSRTGTDKDKVANISDADLKRFPVDNISWPMAQEFIVKLNDMERKAGWEYRLPTEAEWEFACRGGPTPEANKLYHGFNFYFDRPTNRLDPDLANFDMKLGRPRKVGSYQTNRLGLQDMHGNVWEWCEDERLSDEKAPNSAPQRVLRGGSWGSDAGRCTAHTREMKSAHRSNVNGFRLARVPLSEGVANPPTNVPLKPGEEMTNSIGMKLVSIPAGKFVMGSPAEEKEREPDEVQHEVEITKGFWLGKYEVTQEEYEKVMGTNPSHFKGPKLPVEKVSWNDAKEFCKKLSSKEGKEYTLPTEAEWEYACRAGTKGPFSTGENLTTLQANYDGNGPYAGNAKGFSRGRTTEVGSFAANGYGLCDMHGNVWEWCEDWHGPYDTNGVAIDPKGFPGGSGRVIRGGGWTGDARVCRSAYRQGNEPTIRHDDLGFRVALRSVK